MMLKVMMMTRLKRLERFQNKNIIANQQRCINCSYLSGKNEQCLVENGSKQIINLLQSWITPTKISPESILCLECLALLQDRVKTCSEENPLATDQKSSPAFGHTNVCLSCGCSVYRKKKYTVNHDLKETDILLRTVPLHLVSRLERVCFSCSRRARLTARVCHQSQSFAELDRDLRQDSSLVKIDQNSQTSLSKETLSSIRPVRAAKVTCIKNISTIINEATCHERERARQRESQRRATESIEKRQRRLEKMRQRVAHRLATESIEERQRRLEDMRRRCAHRLATESNEERQRRLEDMRRRGAHRIATESIEDRQRRLENIRRRGAHRLATESIEERQRRLEKIRQSDAHRLATESIEKRQQRLEKMRRRSAQLLTTESIEERQQRLEKKRRRTSKREANGNVEDMRRRRMVQFIEHPQKNLENTRRYALNRMANNNFKQCKIYLIDIQLQEVQLKASTSNEREPMLEEQRRQHKDLQNTGVSSLGLKISQSLQEQKYDTDETLVKLPENQEMLPSIVHYQSLQMIPQNCNAQLEQSRDKKGEDMGRFKAQLSACKSKREQILEEQSQQHKDDKMQGVSSFDTSEIVVKNEVPDELLKKLDDFVDIDENSTDLIISSFVKEEPVEPDLKLNLIHTNLDDPQIKEEHLEYQPVPAVQEIEQIADR